MPSGVRLFISHSSAESELAKDAVRALQKRLDGSIEVLYDKDVLDTGDHWRDELWNWWAQCDAAVVVCSRAALDSRWVFIEVTMLMRRYDIDGLPVFPILIDPVKPADLATALFHDQQFTELQATPWTAATLDAEAGAMAAKINQLSVLSRLHKPLFEWESRIAIILQQHATPEVIADAAQAAGVQLEAWMPLSLRARIVARALVAGKPGDVKKPLKALALALDKSAREEVMDLVAAAWLPADDVGPVASVVERPAGKRGLALSTHAPRLARWYIRRASARYPEWKPVEFKRPVGADDLEEVYESICASLRAHLMLDPEDDPELVKESLQRKDANREPVFILVPVDDGEPPKLFAAKLLVQLIERLTAEFAPLSFFVLAGSKPVTLDDAVTSGRILFLQFDPQQANNWTLDYTEAINATG
jgi:hypothetical protein